MSGKLLMKEKMKVVRSERDEDLKTFDTEVRLLHTPVLSNIFLKVRLEVGKVYQIAIYESDE